MQDQKGSQALKDDAEKNVGGPQIKRLPYDFAIQQQNKDLPLNNDNSPAYSNDIKRIIDEELKVPEKNSNKEHDEQESQVSNCSGASGSSQQSNGSTNSRAHMYKVSQITFVQK